MSGDNGKLKPPEPASSHQPNDKLAVQIFITKAGTLKVWALKPEKEFCVKILADALQIAALTPDPIPLTPGQLSAAIRERFRGKKKPRGH